MKLPRVLGLSLVSLILAAIVVGCSEVDDSPAFLDAQAGPWTTLNVVQSGKCLTQSSRNVKAQNCDGGADQQWRTLERPSGYVALQNRANQQCMDVYKAGTGNGVNINTYTCQERYTNQRIKVINRSNGKELRFQHSGKSVDVKDDRTSVHQYAYNGSSDKLFRFGGGSSPSPNPSPSPSPAPNGYNQIQVKQGSNLCLGLGSSGNVRQERCDGGSDQQWKTINRGSGYFALQNRSNGQCLDVYKASKSDRANVNTYTCSSGYANQQVRVHSTLSGDWQQWRFRHSGKCLDIERNNLGTVNALQWTCKSSQRANQQFRLVGGGSSPSPSPKPDPSPSPKPDPSPTPSPSPSPGGVPSPESNPNRNPQANGFNVKFHKGYITINGVPTLWQGDTAWGGVELCNSDMDTYLRNARDAGFKFIQGPKLSDWRNACGVGDNKDMKTPSQDSRYAERVRTFVRKARSYGLMVGVVGVWGDAMNVKPCSYFDDFGKAWAQYLRGEPNVFYLPLGEYDYAGGYQCKLDAMTRGIKAGDPGAFVLFHPSSKANSSGVTHRTDSRIPAHSIQTWNEKSKAWTQVKADLRYKPVIMLEQRYEEAVGRDEVVNQFGRSIFAGASGASYGGQDIYRFDNDWKSDLRDSGRNDVQHIINTVQGRFYQPGRRNVASTLRSDSSIITGGNNNDIGSRGHMEALRVDGSVMVFVPTDGRARQIRVNTTKAGSSKFVRYWWVSTETGRSVKSGVLTESSNQNFTTPSGHRSYILVVDDVAKRWNEPYYYSR